MSTTVEKMKLDSESFETIEKMLSSPDQENVATALMAMEQMDFKKGTMYFALLYRDTVEKQELWKKHAPNLHKNIQSLGLDDIVSYRSMWNTLKGKVTDEEKELFAKRFSKVVGSTLGEWGFKDIMKDLTITVTLKKNAKQE